MADRENDAQASARSEVVSTDDLPPAPERLQSPPTTEEMESSTAVEHDGAVEHEQPTSRHSTDSPADTDSDGPTADPSRDSTRPSRNPMDSPAEDQPASTPAEDQPASTPANENESHSRPDLSELRDELNDQFESIRVLEPGQYELNLMELFDREEYIVALQEDGKYTIQVPERWEE